MTDRRELVVKSPTRFPTKLDKTTTALETLPTLYPFGETPVRKGRMVAAIQ